MGFGEEGTLTEKSLIILTSRSAFVNARTRTHGRCFVNHKRVASDDKTRTARDSVMIFNTNVDSSSLVCFGGAGYSYSYFVSGSPPKGKSQKWLLIFPSGVEKWSNGPYVPIGDWLYFQRFQATERKQSAALFRATANNPARADLERS